MKKIYFTIVFCFVALMAQSQMVAPYSYIEANNVRMRAMGDGSIFSVAFDYNSCKPQEVRCNGQILGCFWDAVLKWTKIRLFFLR